MLDRLGHDAVVCSDDQQCVLLIRDARDHVVNESVVTWDIDKANALRINRRVSKTQIDGQPARLFFLESISVDAGKRLYDRSLSVIDMPGERNDQVSESRFERNSSSGSAPRMSSLIAPLCMRPMTGMGSARSAIKRSWITVFEFARRLIDTD